MEIVPPSPVSTSSSKVLGHQLLQPDGSDGGGGGGGAEASGASPLRPPGTFSEVGEEVILSAKLRTPGRIQVDDGDETPDAGHGTGGPGEDFSRKNIDGDGVGGGVGGGGGEGGSTRNSGRDMGEGGDVGGGGLDEVKRLCSVLEVSLKASRREAMEARRARDMAENTVRQQREDLTRLQKKVGDLEASLAREQEACEVHIYFLFFISCLVCPTSTQQSPKRGRLVFLCYASCWSYVVWLCHLACRGIEKHHNGSALQYYKIHVIMTTLAISPLPLLHHLLLLLFLTLPSCYFPRRDCILIC